MQSKLNPSTQIIEPRRRASAHLPLKWYALHDESGLILGYVQRRSESEAAEVLARNPMVAFLGTGKVKKIAKPPLGWINGQLVKLKDRQRELKREIEALEELL
jgi:hypothetical protein